MASVKDGENVSLESGRRTRSGRTITSEASVLVPNSKKRTTKKQSGEKGAIVSETLEEDEPNFQPTEQNNIPEMLADSARGAVDGESSGSHTVAMREDGQSETRNESPRKDVSVVSEASGKAISEKVRLVTQGALDHDHFIMTNEGVTVHHFDENDSSYLFKKKVFDDADSGQIKISDSVIDSTTRDDTEIPIRDKANHLSPMGADEEDTKDFDYCVVGQSRDDDTDSDLAIAEDFPTNSSEATLANVDTISEDELPLPSKSRLDEADDISSAEDSISKSTELAVGTCIENELPSSNTNSMKLLEATHLKRKMEGSSEKYNQTNSNTVKTGDEPTQKKIKVEGDGDEEQQDKELKKERKKLPDLDKYWKAVKDDSTDFTGWTYLLQYVDQETDIEAAREAYDAFLSHYPYCYGYWRKYADYEKRKGLKSKCNEVFERGLKAIPLSVDLWIHYLNHAKTNYGDNEDYIRTQFERAINACGLEFRSDKLWDAYIKWETEGKRYQRVVKIYDRLLSIPTQGYNGHFGNFQDLINNHSVTETISAEELMKHRSEIRGLSKTSKEQAEDEVVSSDKIEGNDVGNDSDNIRENEEIAILKEKIISARRKIHKSTVAAVTARWTFEESIKRPYFHVKPLERCQLKNWNDYLDFEIEKGDRTRILILFERCLIACALYDEFWLKLIRYLETQNDPELKSLTSDAYSRACTIHHPHKPSLHLMWSAFEECHSDFDKAAKILVDLEKTCPNLLQVAYRRINLERRRGDYDKCKELYEHYINNAKNKNISGSLAIKYARFCNKIMSDLDGGMKVLHQALEKDPANTRVALQMVDMALQRPIVDENEVVNIIDKFMSRENVELEQRALFAQRKVEFLEDFGSTANRLLEAQRALQTALNSVNEAKKKGESSPNKKTTSPRNGKDTAAAINSIPPSTTYNNTNNTSTTYSYGSGTNSNYFAQTGDTSYQQQQYDGYYNHWQYGSGYSGYGQWSGYGNYY